MDGAETIETLVECQVCFDSVPSEDAMAQICHESCNGAMCMHCMSSYLKSCAGSAPRGILSRMKCPLCIRPLNLLRVIKAIQHTGESAAVAQQVLSFRYRVEGSCELLCPECHDPSNLLPSTPTADAAIDDKNQWNDWPDELLECHAEHVDTLVSACYRYCNHDLPATPFLELLQRIPGITSSVDFAQKLMRFVFDPERRVSLFLAMSKWNPYQTTLCCSADVCFDCKQQGHHEDSFCNANPPDMEEMAQCPQCHLVLVKGDGCSTITCYCGTIFEWDVQVAWYELKVRTVAVLASHCPAFKSVLVFLKHRVRRRNYSELVIRRVPAFVQCLRMAKMTPILSAAPWSTTIRSAFQRWMGRRRKLKLTIAAQRLCFQQRVIPCLPDHARKVRLAQLTKFVSQPKSTWMTAFKTLVVRAAARRRFARVLQDIPKATKRRAETKAHMNDVPTTFDPVNDSYD
ncbi:hypothetical protein DYB32_007919 [Aphanomyces invadans]|uniref:RING-type domain-containing protein n=1 Tax=Aphanomyces invadans TaxID=157072 RepID=A0A3R7CW71_9STRA|nr:hypothetical protein DYB32_007919 [Aphanomyces invadans]